jgi:electron transport complex protein RnfG
MVDEPPAHEEVPAWRLVSTLGLGGALAGLLLVIVHQVTEPVITAHKKRVREAAVQEVLHQPERWETLYVIDGRLVAELPEGHDEKTTRMVYAGYQGAERIGFAIPAAKPGFQDMIHLIFGYEPRTKRLLGMRVLDNKETPGLGDKIEKDAVFTGQFEGRIAPLAGVKKGESSAPGDIDMLTGATISSRAVVKTINGAIDELQQALDAYGRDSDEVER